MRACRTIALAKVYQQVLCVQNLFFEDDSVLFIDMHQHEVWPGSGHVNETGRGAGDGFTINIPLPGVYFTPVHEHWMSVLARILRRNFSSLMGPLTQLTEWYSHLRLLRPVECLSMSLLEAPLEASPIRYGY